MLSPSCKGFSNPQVDALLEAARASSDEEQRLIYYFEIQELIFEESPSVVLNQNRAYVVLQSNIRGAEINSTQAHFFGNAYFVEQFNLKFDFHRIDRNNA